MSEEDELNPVADYHVITLVVNTSTPSPQLDIGDIPPQAAITFLEQAAAALKEVLHPPTVIYEGMRIYGPDYGDE